MKPHRIVDPGTFSINTLKIFTKETGSCILVNGYGYIDKGEVILLEDVR